MDHHIAAQGQVVKALTGESLAPTAGSTGLTGWAESGEATASEGLGLTPTGFPVFAGESAHIKRQRHGLGYFG